MSTIIVYYSYSGTTGRLARQKAQELAADLCEIRDKARPGTLAAYTVGCYRAITGKHGEIEPVSVNFDNYDHIVIMSPIWAGKPAPAINSAIALLPAGKSVDAIMISASGHSSARDKLSELVAARGCTLASFENVKA